MMESRRSAARHHHHQKHQGTCQACRQPSAWMTSSRLQSRCSSFPRVGARRGPAPPGCSRQAVNQWLADRPPASPGPAQSDCRDCPAAAQGPAVHRRSTGPPALPCSTARPLPLRGCAGGEMKADSAAAAAGALTKQDGREEGKVGAAAAAVHQSAPCPTFVRSSRGGGQRRAGHAALVFFFDSMSGRFRV